MATSIMWPLLPGRTVVGATVAAINGTYRVEFIDSTGAVLNVTLTEAALLELAGSACVLAEEMDERRVGGRRSARSDCAAQLREQIRAEAAKLRAKYGRITPARTLETDPEVTQGSKTTRRRAEDLCTYERLKREEPRLSSALWTSVGQFARRVGVP